MEDGRWGFTEKIIFFFFNVTITFFSPKIVLGGEGTYIWEWKGKLKLLKWEEGLQSGFCGILIVPI